MGARLVVDNERADNWNGGGGVEVEGAVEVFPGRHVRGKGGLSDEDQYEFCLWDELVPEEVEEVIGDSGKDGKEVIFKIVDGTFSDIVAMDIWQEKLEISVALINDGATILGASLIVKYLDIISVALGF